METIRFKLDNNPIEYIIYCGDDADENKIKQKHMALTVEEEHIFYFYGIYNHLDAYRIQRLVEIVTIKNGLNNK